MQQNQESEQNEKTKQLNSLYDFEKKVESISAQLLTNKTVRSNYKYSSQDIVNILGTSNEEQLRELSRYYWNTSGLYKRMILYMATMLTYDTLIVPKIINFKNLKQEDVVEQTTLASYFIDNLKIEKEAPRIFTNMLLDGVYYGLFKECSNGKYIFQDLDPKYCRVRYKSMNNLPVVELDLTYFFASLKSNQVKTNVNLLQLYPQFIQKSYDKFYNKLIKNKKDSKNYKKTLEEGRWLILPDDLGVAFYYSDMKPFFASTIKAVEDLNEYKDLEKDYDKSELTKLLKQQIPTNSDGEPIFTIEEAAVMHDALVKMLKNNKNIDVFTTLADTDLLELQDSSQANRDNLEKIERSVYNEAGISKNLFATDNTTSLQYSQKADLALALDMIKGIATFLNYIVNKKFSTKKFFLEVSILPITHYNREEMFDLYLKGAQYGYSKILAGIASGIKQSSLLNLITLENEYLGLTDKMIPLQSSHTQSGTEQNGRPQIEENQKSEKTIQNEESL